jgi:hypothetical protein
MGFKLYNVVAIRETEKAVQIEGDNIEPTWVPKSQIVQEESEIQGEDDEGSLVVSMWFADQVGWLSDLFARLNKRLKFVTTGLIGDYALLRESCAAVVERDELKAMLRQSTTNVIRATDIYIAVTTDRDRYKKALEHMRDTSHTEYCYDGCRCDQCTIMRALSAAPRGEVS